EDQSLLRSALKTLLSLEDDIEIIADTGDGGEALALVKTHQPDVLVTDIEMPGLTGIELAETISQLTIATKILMVTTFARPGYLQRAMAAGAKGYFLKDTPGEELAFAIRKVANNETCIDPELAVAAWEAQDPLTPREREILRFVEQGESNKAIAQRLDLSPGTVRNYLAEATAKLGVSNRIEAARLARDKGWL
ncbi:MAG: response regulator transcription factor, partial [Pseudomonadota bacterium]